MNEYLKKNKAYAAFSLAEVLVTLGIIGVVASLTIPTLLTKFQDNQYKTAYKKAYSTLYQAFMNASNDGDIGPLTGTWSSTGADANFEAIKKQFKVVKDCDKNHLSDCWDTTGDIFRNEATIAPSFVDNSGFAWKSRGSDTSTLFPTINVDTNGKKPPNKYGQDRFPFIYATKNINDGSWASNDLGVPTKILPFFTDVFSEDTMACPSLATHPCYYQSWIYN